MEAKKKKNIIEAVVLIVVLALAFIGLWLAAESIQEGQEVKPPDSEITVSMRISGDGWSVEYLNTDTMNNTVFSLLIECSKENDFSVDYTEWHGYDAVFVNAINGTHNGENEMWWQYYVNGEYGDLGSDRKEIFDGDLVEWRFEEPGQ
jgi:hypothetical protein